MMQKYQVLEQIGEGAYGIVLKCRCNDPELTKDRHPIDKKEQDIVAMKQFKQADDNELVKRTTMREVKILKMLDHANIVHLRQAFRKRGFVYLIFQYVQNNLLEVLEKTPEGLDHELIRLMMYQLVKGLQYLHSLNIIHRDIKPENLLISEHNQLKICDFGFARVLRKGKDELTDYVATRWYRPPELLVGADYGKQIDMWAVGCIMGELIDGNPMFPGQNQLDQLFLIQKCLGPLTSEHRQIFLKNPRFIGTKFPEINTLQTIDKRYLGKFNLKGLNFIKNLLKMNPSERLTAQQALSHPYFEGIEDHELARKASINNYCKNQNPLDQDELRLTGNVIASTMIQDRKKKSKNPYNPPLNSCADRQQLEREKTEQSQNLEGSSVFNTGKPSQKLQINKKKKEENIMISTKGISSYNSTNASRSVGKNKISGKASNANYNGSVGARHISLQKNKYRETLTKTQTGFYITGGGIIPERLDEDQDSSNNGHYQIQNQQQTRNKIYNVRSPKSKKNKRKANNFNTEQILQQDYDNVSQSTSQLPFLIIASQKNGDKGGHQPIHNHNHNHNHNTNHGKIIHHHPTPNIIITNNTFNYRH